MLAATGATVDVVGGGLAQQPSPISPASKVLAMWEEQVNSLFFFGNARAMWEAQVTGALRANALGSNALMVSALN